MGGMDRQMVGHAGHAGSRHADTAVIGARQDQEGFDQPDRAVRRDDPEGKIDLAEERDEIPVAKGGELHPRRAEEQAVGQHPVEEIGDFAAAIRRSQHHHAAEIGRAMPVDEPARDEAAHGMGHEMHPRDPGGETRHLWRHLGDDAGEVCLPPRIIQVEGVESLGPEGALHPPEGGRAARDAVKQHDAFPGAGFPWPIVRAKEGERQSRHRVSPRSASPDHRAAEGVEPATAMTQARKRPMPATLA